MLKLDIHTKEIKWKTNMLFDNNGKLGLYSSTAIWGSNPSIDPKKMLYILPLETSLPENSVSISTNMLQSFANIFSWIGRLDSDVLQHILAVSHTSSGWVDLPCHVIFIPFSNFDFRLPISYESSLPENAYCKLFYSILFLSTYSLKSEFK